MNARLDEMFRLNPDFAEAHRKGEKWASQQVDEILGLDGQGSRKYPERNRQQDGTPRNWCGACQHPEGCVMCDLDENPEVGNLLRKVTHK